jgi:hypothetical protein
VTTPAADPDNGGMKMEPLWSLGAVGLVAWGLVRLGGWNSRRHARSIAGMLDASKPCAVRTQR